MLTKFGVESGEINNTTVVDNFDIFPESTSMPSYNQWFRSYDLCKYGVLLKFSFEQNEMPGQILNLGLLPMET
jgi:hypothetical protein